MIFKISPKYDSTYLEHPTLERKVDVYEDRTKGWMIDWASKLSSQEHAGFAALHVALAYFEGYTVFYKGKRSNKKSAQFFKEGFASVFRTNQLSDAQARKVGSMMYKGARCGLFHNGVTRPRIVLKDGPYVIQCQRDSKGNIVALRIDIQKFVQVIDSHFKMYVRRLRDPNEVQLRQNFEKGWNIIHAPVK